MKVQTERAVFWWVVISVLLGFWALVGMGLWVCNTEAQEVVVNPSGLAWDANTEADLAGYHLYEATVSDGQVMGPNFAVSFPKTVTSYTFPAGHDVGMYYWKLTALDTVGNESEWSNEAFAQFDDVPGPCAAPGNFVLVP